MKTNPGKIKENRYDSVKLDVARRAKFDTRPTRDQATLASQADLRSFVAFLTGNPYKTLWQMHIPLTYEDYTWKDVTRKERILLRILSKKLIQSLAPVDPNPEVMREVFSETSHGMRVFEFMDTVGQGDNSNWLAARGLRLTASITYKVLHFEKEEAKRSFLRQHLWGLQNDNEETGEKCDTGTPPAIAHGKAYEKKGVEKYLKYRKTFDSTVFVDDRMGLVAREDYPEFGCSPDAIVYSDYNAPRLLEIKCPFSLKYVAPENYEDALTAKQKSSFCLRKSLSGDIVLKKNHSYYYQVQFSLGILGLEDADFVIYTLKGILVIPIQFDPDWWNENAVKLKEIHHMLIAPEYFLMRTPRNLLPFTQVNIDKRIPNKVLKELIESGDFNILKELIETEGSDVFKNFTKRGDLNLLKEYIESEDLDSLKELIESEDLTESVTEEESPSKKKDFFNDTDSLKYDESDEDTSNNEKWFFVGTENDLNSELDDEVTFFSDDNAASDKSLPSQESDAFSVNFGDEGNAESAASDDSTVSKDSVAYSVTFDDEGNAYF